MFNIMCSTSPKIPPVKTFITAKLDSGASKHYFRPCDTAALTTIKRISNGPSIGLPDGRQLQIQHKGSLPLPNIVDKRAGDVNIVPQLSSASLLSVGQFTNFGCTAELLHSTAIIKKRSYSNSYRLQ